MTRRSLSIFGIFLAAFAVALYISNRVTHGYVWAFVSTRGDLVLTGAIAAGCGYVILKALIDAVVQLRAKQPVERARLGFAVFGGALGLAGVYLYWREVLNASKATITFARQGTDYELLSPKMLGIALLAPFFFWMIGRSLADLPLPQRILSITLRMAFVILLALGLSRLARTATTQKVATVYIIDVSESVPDAAVEDARTEITRALK